MSIIEHRYKYLKKFAKQSVQQRSLPDASKVSKKQAWAYAEDLTIRFEAWLNLGLCEWRHGLANPTKALHIAYESAINAAAITRPFRIANDFPWFPFANAVYVAGILNGNLDRQLTEMLQSFGAWKNTDLVTSYFDIGHFSAITTGAYPTEWDEFILAFSAKPEHLLFHKTNAAYSNIIQKCNHGKHKDSIADIMTAYDLYLQRHDNNFYSGLSATYGGGLDNAHCVDYRLAAIIEICFSGYRNLLQDVPPLHLWRSPKE